MVPIPVPTTPAPPTLLAPRTTSAALLAALLATCVFLLGFLPFLPGCKADPALPSFLSCLVVVRRRLPTFANASLPTDATRDF